MKKNVKFKAFTLAETLLALVILGVVSAMTIPSLKSHSDEQKYVALTKKAFNTFSNAVTLVENKHGNSQFLNSAKVVDYYKEVMDVLPHNGTLNWYGSSTVSGSAGGNIQYNFLTTDGFAWQIDGANMQAMVDVNGSAPPNIMGVDMHNFKLTDYGVSPVNNCTAYIIKHDKMPWLKTPMQTCPTP